ncbi:MAG: histidine phosphatase family protein [Anaerolineae bacterium]
MTHIILIRHGQTMWNKEERIRGQVDIPLDEVGLMQAEATAARIADEWKPVTVYSSPLLRALQTAQAIARKFGLDVQPVSGMNDMHFGQWQGLLYDEIERRWPELAQAWLRTPHMVTFPGGENLTQVRERAMAALYQLIERHPGDEIVIVAHTVVNRVLLCAVLGLENSEYWRIGQDTCAINVIAWRRGKFYIHSLNDTCHLRQRVLSYYSNPLPR